MGVKGCRCVGLTSLPPSCPDCLKIWEPQPPGTLRAWPKPVMGLLYLYIFCVIPSTVRDHSASNFGK
jgi:hypothetical protein